MPTAQSLILAVPKGRIQKELMPVLARVGVKLTQPSAELRDKLRASYEQDTAQLIASSQVIALHFQTVAAANGYWRD